MSAAAAACTRLKTDLPQTIFGCCAGQSNNPLTADSQADASASLSTISIISIHHHQQQQRRHQEAIHCCSPRHATNRTAYTRDATNSLHYRRLQIQPVGSPSPSSVTSVIKDVRNVVVVILYRERSLSYFYASNVMPSCTTVISILWVWILAVFARCTSSEAQSIGINNTLQYYVCIFYAYKTDACLSVRQSRPDERAETPDRYTFWITITHRWL